MTHRFVLTEIVFYLQGSYTRRAESIPALSPSLPEDPKLSLLPKRLKAKTVPRSSPFPCLSLSQSCKQISTLSGTCTCGFQSHHPLAAALPFRVWCAALTLQVVVPELCAMLHRVLVSQMLGPRRHTSQHGTLPPRAGLHPLGV